MNDITDSQEIGIVVPTFHRPKQLAQCLSALGKQTLRPQCVIVVVRKDDEESASVVAAAELPCRIVVTASRAQIPAMTAGVQACETDIVALIDDDAEARPDWLECLSRHLSDPEVGAAGGRDDIHGLTLPPDRDADIVGNFTWYGRLIGNHHLGSGSPRDVAFLKGVNLMVRRRLWDLDPRLRGDGIQTHWEAALCLGIVAQGYRVIYDPGAVVDHHPAIRHDRDQRGIHHDSIAVANAAFNETLVITRWSSWTRRVLHLLYGTLIGTSAMPGLLRLPMRSEAPHRMHTTGAILRARAAAALAASRRC